MKHKSRILLTGAVIGIVLGLLISVPIGSIIWFRDNPSISEVRDAIDENMNLTEDELDQVTQMASAGAVIDFIIKVMLYVLPATCFGTLLGLFGGLLWYRTKHSHVKSTESVV
ncbi:MAG: hypothetical protein GY805_18925 [Chloroflexi bacterium]|nr:hypothetical protein [Chloroflexota bacterium]